VAANGYVHRLVKHQEGEYSDSEGNHINGLEGFWGCLKHRLAAKGGIRREKLPLYLAEYVWRYNHRSDRIEMQKKYLLIQLKEARIQWLFWDFTLIIFIEQNNLINLINLD